MTSSSTSRQITGRVESYLSHEMQSTTSVIFIENYITYTSTTFSVRTLHTLSIAIALQKKSAAMECVKETYTTLVDGIFDAIRKVTLK